MLLMQSVSNMSKQQVETISDNKNLTKDSKNLNVINNQKQYSYTYIVVK